MAKPTIVRIYEFEEQHGDAPTRDLTEMRREMASDDPYARPCEELIFKRLRDRHKSRLKARGFSDEHADDACQTAQIKVHEALLRSAVRSSVRGTLNHAIWGSAVDAYRKAKREPQPLAPQDDEGTDPLARVTDTEGGQHGPEEALVSKRTFEQVLRYLLKLPAKQRTILIEREFEGSTVEETALAADIPEGSVMSGKWWALKNLRKILAAEGITTREEFDHRYHDELPQADGLRVPAGVAVRRSR